METPPRTPPQSPQIRQAPGARRQQRQGMRTPVRQGIQERVPGAPQRQRRAPRENENQDEETERKRRERQEKFKEDLEIAAGTIAPKPGLLKF